MIQHTSNGSLYSDPVSDYVTPIPSDRGVLMRDADDRHLRQAPPAPKRGPHTGFDEQRQTELAFKPSDFPSFKSVLSELIGQFGQPAGHVTAACRCVKSYPTIENWCAHCGGIQDASRRHTKGPSPQPRITPDCLNEV